MYVVSIVINLLSEKVGMAGFTFAKFDIDKTLETMQRADVHYLRIKNFHLPLNSTESQIAAFKAKLKAKGVTGYAVGSIYMKSKAEIDRTFEYAKKVGYTGVCSLEHEKDMADPFMGIAESIGYFRAVIRTTK